MMVMSVLCERHQFFMAEYGQLQWTKRMRRPHNSVQGVTHVVIYLNYPLIKIWYRKMWMRPIATHSNYKILEAIFFQSPPVQMNGSQWTREEIYTLLQLFMRM